MTLREHYGMKLIKFNLMPIEYNLKSLFFISSILWYIQVSYGELIFHNHSVIAQTKASDHIIESVLK